MAARSIARTWKMRPFFKSLSFALSPCMCGGSWWELWQWQIPDLTRCDRQYFEVAPRSLPLWCTHPCLLSSYRGWEEPAIFPNPQNRWRGLRSLHIWLCKMESILGGHDLVRWDLWSERLTLLLSFEESRQLDFQSCKEMNYANKLGSRPFPNQACR